MKRLADLGRRCCRWPVREDADGHWFCSDPARPGLAYCSSHYKRAWLKSPKAREPRVDSAQQQASVVAPRTSGPLPQLDQAKPDAPALGSEENEPAPSNAGFSGISAPEEINNFPGESNNIAAKNAAEEVSQTPALRGVEPICLNGAEPEPIATGEPIFEHANPADLLVEQSYQRDLTPKSVALIRKIALGWDWRKFRPPVVVFTDAGCLIVDGQHTTIAAASRGLASIPIQIVEAPEVQSRAEAFIGLNRDRLQVTPVQLHHAAVAAGDETAVTIEQVCHRAGVTIVRSAYGSYKWKPGETMAVNAIRDLIERRGAMKARMILQALAQAGCAPVAAHEIKAAEHLFSHEDFAAELEPLAEGGGADLALVVKALGDSAAKDAKMFAATHCVPYWKGLAATWFKKCRKRRKAA